MTVKKSENGVKKEKRVKRSCSFTPVVLERAYAAGVNVSQAAEKGVIYAVEHQNEDSRHEEIRFKFNRLNLFKKFIIGCIAKRLYRAECRLYSYCDKNDIIMFKDDDEIIKELVIKDYYTL